MILGNLRSKNEGGRLVSLTYDANNRVSQSVDSGATGTRGFTYDSRGNVVAMGAKTFTYDMSNQPVAMGGDTIGSFVYDGNMRRVKQVIDGKTIYSVYNAAGAFGGCVCSTNGPPHLSR